MLRNADWTSDRTIFKKLVEASGLLAWITDPDGYCVYLSPAWYQFTGQPEKSAEGFGWLDAVHPDDRVKTGQVYFDANARQAVYRVEYRIVTADGGYAECRATGTPSLLQDTTFGGFLGITSPQREVVALPVMSSSAQMRVRVLSDREREVMTKLATGYERAAIAGGLGITERTVSAHIRNAMLKLQANTVPHASVLAVQLNEIELAGDAL